MRERTQENEDGKHMETVREFAERYRLRVNDKRLAQRYRLSWSEDVVPGKYGELAEVNGSFRVRFLAVPRGAKMTGALRNRARRALAAGLECKHKSDDESIFYFDPESPEQVALVIRLVGATYKRRVSPEQAEAARIRFAALRNGPPCEKVLAAGAL